MFCTSQEFSEPALDIGGVAIAIGITMELLGTGYIELILRPYMWEKVKVIPGFKCSTPTVPSGPLFFCVGPGCHFILCLP
jgi:hypothetical protein